MVVVSTGDDENGKENKDWTTPKSSARGSRRKGVYSDEEDDEFGFVNHRERSGDTRR